MRSCPSNRVCRALLLIGLAALLCAAPQTHAAGSPGPGAADRRPPAEAPRSAPAAHSSDHVRVQPSAALPEPRANHTVTRLANGRLLVVGGSQGVDQMLASVLIVSPAARRITAAAPLHTARHDHTATLLPDGRVLVVGGYNATEQWLDDAEIYDPRADTWTVVPPLHPHGTSHTATLLRNGRVLVVGGCVGGGVCTERVEIFNPQTNRWSEAAPLAVDRYGHAALLLADRRVLVVGGWSAQGAPADGAALLYDPRADRWAATASMQTPRMLAQAARLADGRVLVAGGVAWSDQPTAAISPLVEIYDPAADTWTSRAPMAHPRYSFQLLPLPDGQALAIGGSRHDGCCWNDSSFVGAIERYDPAADRWATVGTLPRPSSFAAAAPLPDGRIWLSGGRTATAFLPDTWLISARPRR